MTAARAENSVRDHGEERPRRRGPGLAQVLRLAMREMRGGLRGFSVFIACLALGVMVITAVGALSDALRSGLAAQGETILGGDATVSRTHSKATDEERRWLEQRGRLSETATLRTMARTNDGNEQVLVELKGVDGAYPLVGKVRLGEDAALDAAVAGDGAAVDPIILERLGLKPGDTFHIGEAVVTARAKVISEPDSLSDRLSFGPRIFVSLDTLE